MSVGKLLLPGEPDALDAISLRYRQDLGHLVVLRSLVGTNVQFRLRRLGSRGAQVLL